MPFCQKCGAEVTGAFCAQCGTPVNPGPGFDPFAANPYAVGSQGYSRRSTYWSEPVEVPGFLGAYKMFWKKYAEFNGRASRPEFWFAFLWNFILQFFVGIAGIACLAIAGELESGIFAGFGGFLLLAAVLYGLATICPNIAVVIRRLHDTNKSGLFALLWLIPYVGPLVVLILCALPGTPGDNAFGPEPRRTLEGYEGF